MSAHRGTQDGTGLSGGIRIIVFIYEWFEDSGDETHVIFPPGGIAVLVHPIGRVVHGYYNDAPDKFIVDQPFSGPVRLPGDAMRGCPRVKDILPIMHIQHGIARGGALVSLRTPDVHVARLNVLRPEILVSRQAAAAIQSQLYHAIHSNPSAGSEPPEGPISLQPWQ